MHICIAVCTFLAGVLLRRLQSDPELTGVGAILFDEFHERNLDADLALALSADLQV
jgi:ATP-dependent helicase HrpB